MKLTMHDGTILYTTDHAEMRWLERGGPVESMAREMEAAVQYGAQFGDDQQFWLTPCGMVLAANGKVVTTVLTQAQAIGNMQMYGLHPKTLPSAPKLAPLPERKKQVAPDDDEPPVSPSAGKTPIHVLAVRAVLDAEANCGHKKIKKQVREQMAVLGYAVTQNEQALVSTAVEAALFMRLQVDKHNPDAVDACGRLLEGIDEYWSRTPEGMKAVGLARAVVKAAESRKETEIASA